MFNNFELCELIPHSGKMCLIDSVEKWDDESIICTTQTHLNHDNPLLSNGILPVSALIEYGAQAMAIHGAIIAEKLGEKIQEGYLAALKDVNFFNNLEINNIASPLIIKATRRFASQGNMIYEFLITSENDNLISGRATVVAIFND
ncbi:MAG TPA: 3-hydroxylacyl-ACP dehydratase [Candidatus Marinimicrobia bacterium]|jgi:predicted hotdog family 3-hydroxylacyl-ACP dehydratase|nr:3-hydroxylacyl-ACP dehydratase [Candidatus Neomarinimicrobiota bacterium]